MSACPCCGRPASASAREGGTCGSFACLYRRYCGGLPPLEERVSRPFPWRDPTEVKRIALFRPGQLGDLLLAVPGLRALRKGFPEAEIDLIAQPWALGLDERYQYIDRVLPLHRIAGGSAEPGLSEMAETLARMPQDCPYDLVLQLHADEPASASLALSLRGRITAGFCRDEEIGRAFDLLLPMVADEPEVFRVLRLVHALGARPDGVQLEFPLLPGDAREMDAVIGDAEALTHRPLLALHVGARAPARRWPLDRFAELAFRLHAGWHASLVLVGGPEEASLAAQVLETAGLPGLNLAGRLSLGALAALLARVDIFVGNDSGPAQLAAAVAPRSVRIFGPASRRRWAPLDDSRHRVVYRSVECSPCGHWECPIDHRCLRWVQVEEVLAEVEELLL